MIAGFLATLTGHAKDLSSTVAGPFTIEVRPRRISGGGFPNTSGNPFTRVTISDHRVLHRNPLIHLGVSGQLNWTTREAISGVVQPTIVFGASAGDFILTGDYDGDGLDDYAVWRPSPMPAQSKFIIRRSTNPATLLEVFAGENGDSPVARFRAN